MTLVYTRRHLVFGEAQKPKTKWLSVYTQSDWILGEAQRVASILSVLLIHDECEQPLQRTIKFNREGYIKLWVRSHLLALDICQHDHDKTLDIFHRTAKIKFVPHLRKHKFLRAMV